MVVPPGEELVTERWTRGKLECSDGVETSDDNNEHEERSENGPDPGETAEKELRDVVL